MVTLVFLGPELGMLIFWVSSGSLVLACGSGYGSLVLACGSSVESENNICP